MDKPLINIIVPIYNVESYLEKCIDSILSQTYGYLRVILVDDGSTDRCGFICDAYAQKDDRVTTIHRLNGGLSAARNSGLSTLFNFHSPGEYVTFVDGDDYVTPDYIDFLYRLLCNYHADISQCGHYVVFSDTKVIDKNVHHATYVFNKMQALESLCYNGVYDVTAWNKLYKLCLFDGIRFPEGWNYEDTATCYLIAEKADTLVINMTPKYYYIQRYNSIANGLSFDERKYQFVDLGDKMADYITTYYPELTKAANAKRVFVRLSTLSQMANCGYCEKKQITKLRYDVKKYGVSLLLDLKVSKRDKLGIIALYLGFPFYCAIWRLYYKMVRKK